MARIKLLSVSSLLALVVLTFALIGVCGLDLYVQILSIKNDVFSLTKSLFILSGALAALTIASVSILSARKLRINTQLNAIPKLHLPLAPADMPTRAFFAHTQHKLSETAAIRAALKPLPEEQHVDGYGVVEGGGGARVHFRTAIRRTLEVLSDAVAAKSPTSSPLVFDARGQTLPQYFDRLDMHRIHFNAQAARVYAEELDVLTNRPNEVAEHEYLEFMKQFAVLLRSIQDPSTSTQTP